MEQVVVVFDVFGNLMKHQAPVMVVVKGFFVVQVHFLRRKDEELGGDGELLSLRGVSLGGPDRCSALTSLLVEKLGKACTLDRLGNSNVTRAIQSARSRHRCSILVKEVLYDGGVEGVGVTRVHS